MDASFAMAAVIESVVLAVRPGLEADFEAADAEYAASKTGLADDAKEFASSVGKAFADTSHRVTSVVDNVAAKTWRKHD